MDFITLVAEPFLGPPEFRFERRVGRGRIHLGIKRRQLRMRPSLIGSADPHRTAHRTSSFGAGWRTSARRKGPRRSLEYGPRCARSLRGSWRRLNRGPGARERYRAGIDQLFRTGCGGLCLPRSCPFAPVCEDVEGGVRNAVR